MWLCAALVWSYRTSDFLFFGFEQGRDALVVQRIIHLEDIVLVGPKTDIAGVFHGAWYYYLMAVVYAVGGGSPVFASLFLVVLTSAVVPLMGYWIHTVARHKVWALLTSVLVLGSLEVAQYSRWLSNVTPAVVLMVVSWWCWWQYRELRKPVWFVAAAILAAGAAQFQIILSAWLVVVISLLLITKYLPWPGWKWFIVSAGGAACWYLPWLLFNVKYDFITVYSVMQYLQESQGDGSLLNAIAGWGEQLHRVIRMNVFHVTQPWSLIAATMSIPGLWLAARDKKRRALIFLFGAWFTMSWPVIFFSSSLNLPQLYISTGVAVIGLTVLSVMGYFSISWMLTKLLGGLITLVLVVSVCRSITALVSNQELFFITIQDDLNLHDQRALLSYLHDDAAGQPYRLKAFTIPYYQEEGWQYLHQHMYGAVPESGAAMIYVITEKHVDPYWSTQWTKDLGPTTIITEKWFGQLKLEKRQIVTE